MNRKLKLIWDFRGLDSLGTAKEHCINLESFAIGRKLKFYSTEFFEKSNIHSTAAIIVDEKDMLIYRDALKPHRAEVAK